MIETYLTTPANIHDSNVIEPLIEESDKGQDLYLDAGYENKEEVVKKNNMQPLICEKAHRGRPLTEKQKENNRKKSLHRCRIEHVFGYIQQAMKGSVVRTVGIVKAKASVSLTSLCYNMYRYIYIVKNRQKLITNRR